MQVTYEVNGKAYYSRFEDEVDKEEIKNLLHTSNKRKQKVKAFKAIVGNLSKATNNTIGYALDEIEKKKFYSEVTDIQFHSDKVTFCSMKF
jgi:hypothetical protein